MIKIEIERDSQGAEFIEVALRGRSLLGCPVLSKGTAFPRPEREALGLSGILPTHVRTLEEQTHWAYEEFKRCDSDILGHINLRALQDNLETVFFRLAQDHLAELMPYIYTPVVGDACRRYSGVFRRGGKGLFISYEERGNIDAILDNRPYHDVDIVVVTDGERILGLGDQGIGGMPIPIGKLALYTLCAGIHPARTLPILLDCGTDNQSLLRDPLYIGWRHHRIRGAEYDDFIETFVDAVARRLPGTLLQWEDFALGNARRILERYRERLPTFNDDIQGTAATVVATLLAAARVTGTRPADSVVAVLGAGSAGLGICDAVTSALVAEGVPPAEARSRIWLVDKQGLLHDGMKDLSPYQRPYARPRESLAGFQGLDAAGGVGLAETLRRARPSVLVGVSGKAGLFDQESLRALAAGNPRPLVLPLSNPSACAEARPEDVLAWTEGRALVATGSPFPPVRREGLEIPVSQCNNAYIFPGVGLGVLASRATRVTDGMMMAAARALAGCCTAGNDPQAPLLPPIESIRSVSRVIALSVARQAQAEGVAPSFERRTSRADAGDGPADWEADALERAVDARVWEPRYTPYRAGRPWSW
jgi:malate dehydrogenase (oxaloacetate-decarboxylating)